MCVDQFYLFFWLRMRFFSYVKDARKTIMSNKMRSGLSTLWIVIGMASVIVMLAIGQGVDNMISENMGDMAQNKLSVSSNAWWQTWKDDGSSTYVKQVTFTPSIIPYIETYFPELTGMITYQITWPGGQVKIKTVSDYVSIAWVPKNRFTLNEKELSEGNLFSDKQYEDNAFVAIVNSAFKDKFYPNTSPIGKKVTVDKKEYSIVGLLKAGQFEFMSQLYIPDTTIFNRINHNTTISNFDIFLQSTDDNELWQNRITYLLLKKYNIASKSDAGFEVSSFAKFLDTIKSTTGMMKTFLLFIGGLSLLIWGIGVMNIMIVSVTERTREIWIRKAIGALNSDIVMQFLIESIVITFIGGFLALGLSFVAVKFVNSWLLASTESWGESSWLTAVIDLTVVALSFWLTALTGILFGILPARKAAKLKPIDALRFE